MTPTQRSNRIASVLIVAICFALDACGGGGGGSTPAPQPAAPSALSYTNPQIYTVGAAIAPLVPGVNGAVTQYSVSPALPGGLLIDTATGQISGTPTTASMTVNPLFLLEPQTSTTIGAGLSSTNFYSIDSTIADWIARNNVLAVATFENVTPTTTCYRYATPANGAHPSAPVVLCKSDPPDSYDAVNDIVFGGRHSWPGGVRSPAANSDVPVADFDANAYLWRFFNQ